MSTLLEAPPAGLVNAPVYDDLTLTTISPQIPPSLEDGWRLYECVDGHLVEKTMRKLSQHVANNLKEELTLWTRATRTGGRSYVEATFRCFPHDPEQVRRPDVAYLTASQLASGGWEQAYSAPRRIWPSKWFHPTTRSMT